MAYIDREIIQEKTGKKNLKTGKDIEKGKVVGESRVIRFRDDSYSVDSKCRFADIIDSIPFDSDELIKALQDAILKEQNKSGVTVEDAKAKQDKEALVKEKAATKYIETKKKNKVDEKKNAELIDIVKTKYPKATDEVKEQIKVVMAENKIENFKSIDVPTNGLEEIVALLA
jgi:hypothetical protein